MAVTNLFNSSNVKGGTCYSEAMEGRHQLLIDGNSADTVKVIAGFSDTHPTAIIQGHTYEVYNKGRSGSS